MAKENPCVLIKTRKTTESLVCIPVDGTRSFILLKNVELNGDPIEKLAVVMDPGKMKELFLALEKSLNEIDYASVEMKKAG